MKNYSRCLPAGIAAFWFFTRPRSLFLVFLIYLSLAFLFYWTVVKDFGCGQVSSPATSRYLLGIDNPSVENENGTVELLILEATATNRNIPLPPFIVGEQEDGPGYYQNASCARFPTIYDIEFRNTYWQTLKTSNGTFYFYGAYYDIRAMNQQQQPLIRILAMIERMLPIMPTHCQIWFESEREPQFSKVLDYKHIWYSEWGGDQQGVLQPYLLTCQVPESHQGRLPASVSIVEEPCNAANNNIRVQFSKPLKKKDFAVCVKGLDFIHKDLSVRLVEWIELLGILGADKIFFYNFAVHPNISKVLHHYTSTGQIDVTTLTLPGGLPNDAHIRHVFLSKNILDKRQNEVIPYNDCLYRNLYSYKYVALLDIDEVIMPIKVDTWKELVKVNKKFWNESYASFDFRNVYFLNNNSKDHTWFRGIQRYMYMLQNVYRSRNHSRPQDYVKCFHDPELVETLHNHFPISCLREPCTSFSVATDMAQLQHYRADCVSDVINCDTEYRQNPVLDTTIWKYKNVLIERTQKELMSMGFISSTPSNS